MSFWTPKTDENILIIELEYIGGLDRVNGWRRLVCDEYLLVGYNKI